MTEQTFYTIWFFVGVFLLSVAVSYAWWMKIRVLWLRQDIFDMRDRLFMESASLGLSQDVAAKSARDHLNTLARIASVISIPFVITAITKGIAEVRQLPESPNARMNSIIKGTMKEADARIARYLLRATMLGWAFVITSRLVFMTWLLREVYVWVTKWRESDAVEDALRILGIQSKEALRILGKQRKTDKWQTA